VGWKALFSLACFLSHVLLDATHIVVTLVSFLSFLYLYRPPVQLLLSIFLFFSLLSFFLLQSLLLTLSYGMKKPPLSKKKSQQISPEKKDLYKGAGG